MLRFRYINPFVIWTENGRKWQCNMCGYVGDTPQTYYCHLDDTMRRADRYERPELVNGTIDFIAPAEYMVRPPQPPVFMFLLESTYQAVASGALASAAAAIKELVEKKSFPGGERALVGVMTFDSSIHFYNLNSRLSQPQMLVVSDLEDPFLPLPDDILVPVISS
ncbi:vesicle transport protein, putative, partial [Perkinsus marinus ATCC 50983]